MSGFTRSSGRRGLGVLIVLAGAGLAAVPAAATERRAVPVVTIYPGDIIREQMLTDADFTDAVASSVYVTNHAALVGKVSKRTLLPGAPIPTSAIGVPRVVTIGSMVRVVFEEDGLVIATYASALQNGAAGDVIAVRNMESGVTISGVIRSDGSIHVGPS